MIQNSPKISLIASIGLNRELGRGNELLFKIPEDMKMFKEKTTGHAIIMGRKTYESIGRPLPHRTNIVISRDTNYLIPDTSVRIAHSLEEAIEIGKTIEQKELFVIGGAQIYELAIPYADKLYLTVVGKKVNDADAFFPDYKEFSKVLFERRSRDDNYSYTFLDLSK